uniref:Eukaryotic translation initiation factor 5A n=1 Tax=Fabrea salina TaxID=342563 RepID=A0A7S3IA05_9CILI|mmetsp:Transcript_313/g.556  ORF Transcript_313/g.556 Transcript_313/m.556 type:complete len:149 (+) Transcript_313:131-577(+)
MEGASASGASMTVPTQVGSLRKGGHVILKEHPCKIVEINTAKVGKHGSAKSKITGIDIFTGSKHEEIHPTGHNIDVPNVDRKDYTLVNIEEDGFLSLMTEEGDTKEDLKLPDDEEGRKIRELFEKDATVSVTVMSAMGQEKIIQGKEI